jgi:hypothetical protein
VAQVAVAGKLLSPARRRRAVAALQERLGFSERRACRLAGQHRSTQRHERTVAVDDAAIRAQLRAFSRKRPRWGYHQHLLEEGWSINRKRVQRLWREEGLRVMIEDFRQDYNRRRPHRAHGMMAPAAFKAGWETTHQAAPASVELRHRYAPAPPDTGDTTALQVPTTHPLSQQVDQ